MNNLKALILCTHIGLIARGYVCTCSLKGLMWLLEGIFDGSEEDISMVIDEVTAWHIPYENYSIVCHTTNRRMR